MATYLCVKVSSVTKKYTAKTTSEEGMTYLRVKDGFFPLTTETTSGLYINLKYNGSTYRIVETYTTSREITVTTNTSYLTTQSTYSTTYGTRASTSSTTYGTRKSTSSTTYGTRKSTSSTTYGWKSSTSSTSYLTVSTTVKTISSDYDQYMSISFRAQKGNQIATITVSESNRYDNPGFMPVILANRTSSVVSQLKVGGGSDLVSTLRTTQSFGFSMLRYSTTGGTQINYTNTKTVASIAFPLVSFNANYPGLVQRFLDYFNVAANSSFIQIKMSGNMTDMTFPVHYKRLFYYTSTFPKITGTSYLTRTSATTTGYLTRSSTSQTGYLTRSSTSQTGYLTRSSTSQTGYLTRSSTYDTSYITITSSEQITTQ